MVIEWYSGSVPTSFDVFATITAINVSHFENATFGEDGYCSIAEPCNHNEGDCDFDIDCTGVNVHCIDNGCPSHLGLPPGTDCCIDTTSYCSEFLKSENGTWTLQTPLQNWNNHTFEVHCKWYIDVMADSHLSVRGSGSETCGATASDPYCCTHSLPCVVGDGDCDSDSECQFGLACGYKNCGPFSPSHFDCCEPQKSSYPGDTVVNVSLQTFEVSALQ